jgi:hypothetical protein
MPITDRSQAKEGGFAQVREALLKFKGTVIPEDTRGNKTEFAMWGGELVDAQGKKKQPREFLQIVCKDVEILEVAEEITMDIAEGFSFRENCSDFKGSFWIDMFLASADKFKIMIPDGLMGKRITWEKMTLEAVDKDGNAKPEYNSTNYVIVGVEAGDKPQPKKVAAKVTTKAGTPSTTPVEVKVTGEAIIADPMDIVEGLAIGKTEAELKTAITTHPAFISSPVAPMAKSGIITQALLNAGRLVLVDGKYQKPG